MLTQVETRTAAPEMLLEHGAPEPAAFLRTDSVVTGYPAAPAESTDLDRVVLTRGPNMMVLFRGCPRESEIGELRDQGVTIGLALSPGELSAVPDLDDYGYVCISTHWRARSILAEAATDLKRGGWSIDDTPF